MCFSESLSDRPKQEGGLTSVTSNTLLHRIGYTGFCYVTYESFYSRGGIFYLCSTEAKNNCNNPQIKLKERKKKEETVGAMV